MRTFALILLAAAACNRAPASDKHADKPATTAEKPAATAEKPAATASANKVGEPISATAPVVALADVMKNPAAYKGKSFVTSGTVTAVCQEMGCWMEIKDANSEAHIKMAGEKFSVPKTSAGHQARVQGTLVDAADNDSDCADEPADQTGKQVAKLQLEATGVELN